MERLRASPIISVPPPVIACATACNRTGMMPMDRMSKNVAQAFSASPPNQSFAAAGFSAFSSVSQDARGIPHMRISETNIRVVVAGC